jgi:site-specific recombinase XerD
MDEYEQYEQECNLVRIKNQKLLNEFESWLADTKLSKKTIDNHYSNINFYINEFLLYESIITAAEGIDRIDEFLGYWFIRKALWASESSIRSNATSFKKFYTFMYERGAVSFEALQMLKAEIKENLPEWIATVQRYDDPDIAPKDVWGF